MSSDGSNLISSGSLDAGVGTHDHLTSGSVVLQSRTHLPTLDGLRGVAILMVLLSHFVQYRFDGNGGVVAVLARVTGYGWLGVDLFFVLSGFLITGILYDTKGAKHFFKYFYLRRVLRIFPLYYVYVVVVVLVVGLTIWLHGSSGLLERAFHDGAWAAVYMTNFEIAIHHGNITAVFNHFWSLAIEEQFYFIWPAVVAYTARRRLQLLCVCLIAGALLLRGIVMAAGIEAAIGTLMPCRMDCLAVGAFVALVARAPGGLVSLEKLAKYVFAGALLIVGVCACSSYPPLHQNLFMTAVACTFAGLLGWVVTAEHGSVIATLFGNAVLRTFGKYSYGLYVLNQEIAFFPGRTKLHEALAAHLRSEAAATVLHASLGIGITFIAAWLSWHLLEKRFLKLKNRYELDDRPQQA